MPRRSSGLQFTCPMERALTVATPDHLFFMPNGKEFLVVLPDGGFRFMDAVQVVNTGRNGARAKSH